MSKSIRVLIVDDSPLASGLLTSILEADPEIHVVGVARDGVDALEQIPTLKPDLVTMDVWMPRMDGFAAVEQLMAYHPTPILVVTTSLARSDVDISLTMLAAGALDVIEKPARTDEASWTRACKALIQKVKVLSQVRVVTHLKGRRLGARVNGAAPPAGDPRAQGAPGPAVRANPPPPAPPPVAPTPLTGLGHRRGGTAPLPPLPPHLGPGRGQHYEMIVIASSTGGPQALLKILRGLPPNFAPPMLIVQHIAEGFTQGLADWLSRESRRVIRLAVAGEHPAPRTILLAPDGQHLLLQPDGGIGLLDGPPREIRPSADVTMRSLAAVLGKRAIGVILTGMGRDGADGLRAMRLAGAYTIAQDEASSIIFGMPRAAINMGIVDEVLSVDAIAGRLVRLVES